ncbi:TPA: N-6 DNA methylase [Acinetobacter baumannii]|nr:N-6 DNA methylase [Acinetobacter baumannii]HCS1002987.1 N-6 DNA methylase [Acinetobacter baumannii]
MQSVAKKPTKSKVKSFEESLWDSANKLRGSVEPSEYKHIVLSLIFLKFVSDTFEAQRKKIAEKHGANAEKFLEIEAFYHQDNVFYLTEESRWSYLIANAKQEDIALKIDTALHNIEKKNKALQGALPDNYFSRIDLEVSKLAALLDEINNIQTISNQHEDVVGRVYEYFLGNFALAEGKGKGEFYTPKSIVKLIASMIEPYKGRVYDPACGSGGMFVQSMKFVENHKGNRKDISIFGQEQTTATYKLAKMNLAIRGISADLGAAARDTFSKDQHPDQKFDFIMANPPFNQKDWRGADELTNDARWEGYEVPPTGNANYGWILHMVSKLSQNGVAGFILANGALSGDGTEKEIRKKLIENKLVEAILILPRNMFYTTDISVTLWILNRNKKSRVVENPDVIRKYRDRENEILFMDLRQLGEPFEKKFVQFSDLDIEKISSLFHVWQEEAYSTEYKNIPEFCYSATIEEIKNKDYSLIPSKYIEFVNRDEKIDFDKQMLIFSKEIQSLLLNEKKSNEALVNLFKELGYEINL